MAGAITSWIARLEFSEELHSCLIWMLFQPLKHFSPVSYAALRTGATAARFFAKAAVFESPDYHAPCTRVLTPQFHALGQTIYVLRMEASRKLNAQLLE